MPRMSLQVRRYQRLCLLSKPHRGLGDTAEATLNGVSNQSVAREFGAIDIRQIEGNRLAVL